jgi:hypothetical protein
MVVMPRFGIREGFTNLGAKLLPITHGVFTFDCNGFRCVLMLCWLIIVTQNTIHWEFYVILAGRDRTVEHDILASVTAFADFLVFKTLLDSVEISYVHLLLQAYHQRVLLCLF